MMISIQAAHLSTVRRYLRNARTVMRWRRGVAAAGLTMVMVAVGGLAGVPTARAATLQLQAVPSSDIACQQTPFGRSLTVGMDQEMVELLAYGSNRHDSLFREWNLSGSSGSSAPPFASDISEMWRYYDGVQGPLLKALRADLNGDGRDEIVIAMDATEDGVQKLSLGVFRREPHDGSEIDLFSTWTLNVAFDGFDMVAGDFDGSRDGRQELAVMLHTSTVDHPNNLNVLLLTGDGAGGIAQHDNVWAGFWTWHPPSDQIGLAGMGAGSVLLNGRDQIIVVAEADQDSNGGTNRRLTYHVLEYQSPSPALVVQPGSWNLASKSFEMFVGSTLADGEAGLNITRLQRIDVHAGDVAGGGKAELVTDIGFKTSGGHGTEYAVHQFLQHFQVSRDADRAVIGVQLASRPNGDRYDSSQLISANQYLPGNWDVALHNIDDDPHQEIVVVRHDVANQRLVVEVYKAGPDLTASFRYFRTGHTVQFHETSVGLPQAGPFASGTPRWEFGDGGTTNKVNPNHEFQSDGKYRVTLSIRQQIDNPSGGSPTSYWDSFEKEISIDSGTDSGSGGIPEHYMYRVISHPYYAAYYEDNGVGFGPVQVAVGGMDGDGFPEIMTLVKKGTGYGTGEGMLRSLWQLEDPPGQQPMYLAGRHMLEQAGSSVPIDQLTSMVLIPADFDGDSVHATIGADCRAVTESRIHQVIWAPPYFERLQADSAHSASFGKSVSNGQSAQSSYGSYTGISVSGYAGVEAGVELFGIVGGSAKALATAGRYRQAAQGKLQGQTKSFALTQGWTQTTGDGLVTLESNLFYCYSYNVSQASVGLDPDSYLRICQPHDPEHQTAYGSGSPQLWNRVFPATWAGATGGHTPPYWVPLTRDWASLSLFKPVSTNAAYLADHEPRKMTDGFFTTAVRTQPRDRPYLQIDLGSVQPITVIRVFAPKGESTADLTGSRVYTSVRPMSGVGIPSGPDVREFTPDSLYGIIRERWNIWTRVWNSDLPGSEPGDPLRARYIRLQSPRSTSLQVAEIQVFGDVHEDPPRYPEAVCDPHMDDGLFKAKVWDPATYAFHAVQVHGDILWFGAESLSDTGWGDDNSYLEACINDAAFLSDGNDPYFDVWDDRKIGAPGSESSWSFVSTAGATTGTTTSFESSTSVGAEFEATLSAGVSFVVGGSKEFSTGMTRDHQSTTFWSEDVDMGGTVGGMRGADVGEAGAYYDACHYNAQPYAFKLRDYANTGYADTMYVVDYVVPQGIGATAWTRGNLPPECQPLQAPGGVIFRDGFELP